MRVVEFWFYFRFMTTYFLHIASRLCNLSRVRSLQARGEAERGPSRGR